jgi:hypothetical protein
MVAAAVALTAVAGGIFATGSAGAETYNSARRSTTTKAPNTIPICYAGPNCQRTKNAALPATTTTKPKTVTTPMPTIKPRTKNKALPTTTKPPSTLPRPTGGKKG